MPVKKWSTLKSSLRADEATIDAADTAIQNYLYNSAQAGNRGLWTDVAINRLGDVLAALKKEVHDYIATAGGHPVSALDVGEQEIQTRSGVGKVYVTPNYATVSESVQSRWNCGLI